MLRIILVHGRGAKPTKACKLRYIREVLTESVRRVDARGGAWLARHHGAIQLAYYADLFRRLTGEPPEECKSFRQPIARLLKDSRDCPAWLRFESFMQGVGVDVTSHLVRLLNPSVRRRLLTQQFGDVMRYFRDHALGSRVRARLEDVLIPSLRRREQLLLIAHSLGSVVAYDVLWKLSHLSEYAALRHRKIDHFITMGSPLGDQLIKARLLGWRDPVHQRYPTQIARWTNLSARGDMICHDARLANDFQPMITLGYVDTFQERVNLCTVYRGREGEWNAHKLYGYLILPELGRLVADYLRTGAGTFPALKSA